MTLPKNVAELQGENVVFELECIDRMYLNLYVPQLASAPGVAAYFRGYKGHRFASTKEAVAMSEGFRRQVFDFAERHGIPIIRFEKGMRKDDVMHKRLRKFKAREGVVFIGIAQEKARVPRTIRKGFGEGEGTIPWIDYTTAMEVNLAIAEMHEAPSSARGCHNALAGFLRFLADGEIFKGVAFHHQKGNRGEIILSGSWSVGAIIPKRNARRPP